MQTLDEGILILVTSTGMERVSPLFWFTQFKILSCPCHSWWQLLFEVSGQPASGGLNGGVATLACVILAYWGGPFLRGRYGACKQPSKDAGGASWQQEAPHGIFHQ